MLYEGFGQEGGTAPKYHNGGFTLIEILVVVAVLMIAAVMVVPMMSSAGSVQLRSAANMLAADLEFAKSVSITTGQNHTVVFDSVAERYSIENASGDVIAHPVKKGFNYSMDFTSEQRLNRVTINSVDFNSASQVQFDCLGSPDNGGTVILEADGETLTVNVEPVTGFISILD